MARLWVMVTTGEVLDMAGPSLYRVGYGMLIAVVIGVPLGILIGADRTTARDHQYPVPVPADDLAAVLDADCGHGI